MSLWLVIRDDIIDPFTSESDAQQHASDCGEGAVVEVVSSDQLAAAVRAMEAVRDYAGRVCNEYETCDHRACRSSYAAWAIADRFLAGDQDVTAPLPGRRAPVVRPSARALTEARKVNLVDGSIEKIVQAAYDVDAPTGSGGGEHHPALAESGELEIAQRQALHEAQHAAQDARRGALPVSSVVICAIEAYLSAMRRAWQPGPVVIGEGDHIVVEIDGKRVKVAHERDGSEPRLSLDDGAEIHYLQGIA